VRRLHTHSKRPHLSAVKLLKNIRLGKAFLAAGTAYSVLKLRYCLFPYHRHRAACVASLCEQQRNEIMKQFCWLVKSGVFAAGPSGLKLFKNPPVPGALLS
jgi:hypothetical protein